MSMRFKCSMRNPRSAKTTALMTSSEPQQTSTAQTSISMYSDMGLRRVVIIIALANLAYFFFAFAMARRIGSVSLFVDSIAFLDDDAVNLLIALAIGWRSETRSGGTEVVSLCYSWWSQKH